MEFFNPDPKVDFHGLKNLLRQLFDIDNQLFDLSELADLILSQPLLGSTVKTDGEESDPFAFLTVLNMQQHRNKAVVQQLTKYIIAKAAASGDAELQRLEALLSDSSKAQVGLILREHVNGMPHQIVPPLYNMLLEEIQWALDEKEPYQFTHYLVISKTYLEVESKLDAETNPPPSKKKKSGGAKDAEISYYHPEDVVLHEHALGWMDYGFDTLEDEGAADARRAFTELGVKPQGHLILIEGGKFKDAARALTEYLSAE